jgi:hypothetical protein
MDARFHVIAFSKRRVKELASEHIDGGVKNTTLNVAVVSQEVVRPLGGYDRQLMCSN